MMRRIQQDEHGIAYDEEEEFEEEGRENVVPVQPSPRSSRGNHV